MELFVELIKVAGPACGIALGMVIYFMRLMAIRDKRDADREARLGARIDELEDYIKGELAALQAKSIEALLASAESQRQLAAALGHVPCLVDQKPSVSGPVAAVNPFLQGR